MLHVFEMVSQGFMICRDKPFQSGIMLKYYISIRGSRYTWAKRFQYLCKYTLVSRPLPHTIVALSSFCLCSRTSCWYTGNLWKPQIYFKSVNQSVFHTLYFKRINSIRFKFAYFLHTKEELILLLFYNE